MKSSDKMQGTTRQQRRRKKQNKLADSDEKNKSIVGIDGGTNHGRERTKEEVLLSDALERIMAVRTRTIDLYTNWNTQLLRLSLLVLFMTIYQSYGPFQQAKAAFEPDTLTKQHYSSLPSILTQNYLMEIFQILLSFFIFFGLRIQTKRFKHLEVRENEAWSWFFQWPFLISTVLSILTVYLYWMQPTYIEIEAEKAIQREFPVSVVFYLIVTGVYIFMSTGLKPTDDNLRLLRKLQNRLKSK